MCIMAQTTQAKEGHNGHSIACAIQIGWAYGHIQLNSVSGFDLERSFIARGLSGAGSSSARDCARDQIAGQITPAETVSWRRHDPYSATVAQHYRSRCRRRV